MDDAYHRWNSVKLLHAQMKIFCHMEEIEHP